MPLNSSNLDIGLRPHVENSKHDILSNVGLMIDQRRRRCASIKPTFGQRFFIGCCREKYEVI